MPTLNELLDVNMSYNDILDSLSDETDDFTIESGEVMFDDLYESEVAADILRNHYETIEEKGMDLLNSEQEGGFVIAFSGVFDNDIYDMPVDDIELEDEEVQESLNEDLKGEYKSMSSNKLVEKIVKKGSKWQVQSEDGTKNLGTYDTKEKAKKRLQQIHFFKSMNEAKSKEPDKLGIELEELKSQTSDDLYALSFDEFKTMYPEFTKTVILTFLKEMGILSKEELNDASIFNEYWPTGELILPDDWDCLFDGAETLSKGESVQWEKIYKKYYKVNEELTESQSQEIGRELEDAAAAYGISPKELDDKLWEYLDATGIPFYKVWYEKEGWEEFARQAGLVRVQRESLEEAVSPFVDDNITNMIRDYEMNHLPSWATSADVDSFAGADFIWRTDSIDGESSEDVQDFITAVICYDGNDGEKYCFDKNYKIFDDGKVEEVSHHPSFDTILDRLPSLNKNNESLTEASVKPFVDDKTISKIRKYEMYHLPVGYKFADVDQAQRLDQVGGMTSDDMYDLVKATVCYITNDGEEDYSEHTYKVYDNGEVEAISDESLEEGFVGVKGPIITKYDDKFNLSREQERVAADIIGACWAIDPYADMYEFTEMTPEMEEFFGGEEPLLDELVKYYVMQGKEKEFLRNIFDIDSQIKEVESWEDPDEESTIEFLKTVRDKYLGNEEDTVVENESLTEAKTNPLKEISQRLHDDIEAHQGDDMFDFEMELPEKYRDKVSDIMRDAEGIRDYSIQEVSEFVDKNGKPYVYVYMYIYPGIDESLTEDLSYDEKEKVKNKIYRAIRKNWVTIFNDEWLNENNVYFDFNADTVNISFSPRKNPYYSVYGGDKYVSGVDDLKNDLKAIGLKGIKIKTKKVKPHWIDEPQLEVRLISANYRNLINKVDESLTEAKNIPDFYTWAKGQGYDPEEFGDEPDVEDYWRQQYDIQFNRNLKAKNYHIITKYIDGTIDNTDMGYFYEDAEDYVDELSKDPNVESIRLILNKTGKLQNIYNRNTGWKKPLHSFILDDTDIDESLTEGKRRWEVGNRVRYEGRYYYVINYLRGAWELEDERTGERIRVFDESLDEAQLDSIVNAYKNGSVTETHESLEEDLEKSEVYTPETLNYHEALSMLAELKPGDKVVWTFEGEAATYIKRSDGSWREISDRFGATTLEDDEWMADVIYDAPGTDSIQFIKNTPTKKASEVAGSVNRPDSSTGSFSTASYSRRKPSPYERTRASVYATGNKWAIDNWRATHESLDEARNETLNQDIWDENDELRPEVREKLELIVEKFKESLKEDGVELQIDDVEIIGSNANYNYTPYSDIDLHIIADLSIYKDREDLAQVIYNAYRRIFNDKFDPMIRGHEVELYVEPSEDRDNDNIPDEVDDAFGGAIND